jgi:hypothetical protein
LGFYGSKILETAMSDTPCGCELLVEAEKEPHDYTRRENMKFAQECQQRWMCPCAGYQPGELDEGCQSTLIAVERLTKGASGFNTCPIASLRRGTDMGESVERARVAFHYFDKGQLSIVEGKMPPNTLTEAILLIQDGILNRKEYEAKEQQEKDRIAYEKQSMGGNSNDPMMSYHEGDDSPFYR